MTRDKVWVCRGWCCGTRTKRPGIDHRALDKQLRAVLERPHARPEQLSTRLMRKRTKKPKP